MTVISTDMTFAGIMSLKKRVTSSICTKMKMTYITISQISLEPDTTRLNTS